MRRLSIVGEGPQAPRSWCSMRLLQSFTHLNIISSLIR